MAMLCVSVLAWFINCDNIFFSFLVKDVKSRNVIFFHKYIPRYKDNSGEQWRSLNSGVLSHYKYADGVSN